MGPLAGLRVIDLSPNRVGAQISQLFADFGADVVQVEPPGGAIIRQHAAYPFWGRGKRSIVLDVHDEHDAEVVRRLARSADVFVETHQPGVLEGLGLGFDDLRADNPRLIYTSVTGFGRQGPYADAPGYEGVVHAKLGVFHTFRRMSPFVAPPFVNVPFASFAASQVALHGILAALLERERSGAGQRVETNLLQAFTTLDTWAWFEHLIADRWPDAFHKADPYDAQGRPASPLTFMLMICLTKDGHWLQFASVAPRLFAALMKALGLDWMFGDENWKGLPLFGDDADKRQALWTKMLEAARSKTLAEWTQIFDEDSNVFAEQFRNGPIALDHPQLLHDGFVVQLDDAERGTVRQPAAIVKAAGTPADLKRSAPRLDEHRASILAEAAEAAQVTDAAPAAAPAASHDLPLAGVTILELATLFAAPHGTTLLTDLGARVIKVEPLAGDMIRNIIPFPESGGAKVMQGKESIAINLSTPEGLAAVEQLASKADVVIQGYRAGAMARLGLDYASVKRLNPDVIYVNAPGYGVDGPYGNKPAYAPSIGAASGFPLANVGQSVEERADLTMKQIQDGARRLSAAGALANAQADGIAALGVATAILFGLTARTLGAGGQELFSSMLNSGAHAMSAQAVTYPDAPKEPAPDAELRGLGSLYRIYDAAEGYVFLAAPSTVEWERLCGALRPYTDLAGDARFADPALRHTNTKVLIDVLAALFASRPAQAWEDELLPLGVACVALNTGSIEKLMFDDSFGRASGYVVDVVHPTFEDHPRLAPYIRFSRSTTQALPGVLAGQHTDEILTELGKTADEIADLRARSVVG
jgi:crotonobetainyl-CoA:carnitine CoA-transferase CaiB-like acyl-CoA transferase